LAIAPKAVHKTISDWREWWRLSFAFDVMAKDMAKRADELEQKWDDRYAELRSLPQLFIAI
jgi:hypothetical protein